MIQERSRVRKKRLSETETQLALENFPGKNMVGIPSEKFFIGQRRARKQLGEVITQSPSPAVVVISELLGTGKSALISVVQADFVKSGFATLEECLRINHFKLQSSQSVEELYGSGIKPKVCFIEGFDRKTPFFDLQEGVRRTSQFLEADVPVTVLSGDYSLKNPDLVRLIKSPRDPIHISLEPLRAGLLKRAVGVRLGHALKISPAEIDTDFLFEKSFLDYLIPNTEPPTANMRTALTILQEMADVLGIYLDNQSQPARFSGSLYEELVEETEREIWLASVLKSTKTWHFMSWFHDYIDTKYEPKVPMRAMTVSELRSLYDFEGSSEEECRELLRDLARVGLLVPVGIPYLKDPEDSLPEPYLPSQRTFLDAAFYPLFSEAPSERSGEREVMPLEKALMLRDLRKRGVISEEIYSFKMSQVLGLDRLLDMLITGKIDEGMYLETKEWWLRIIEKDFKG